MTSGHMPVFLGEVGKQGRFKFQSFKCYDQLLGWLIFSHMYISLLFPFTWSHSIYRGPIHFHHGSLFFFSHTLPLECSYPCFPSALLFLIGVGFSNYSLLCFLIVTHADSFISTRWFSYTISIFPLTHLVLLGFITFFVDVSYSTYISLPPYCSLCLFYTIQDILLCPSLTLSLLTYLSQFQHFAFVSKNVASLHKHLPYETIQATPVSKLSLCNIKGSKYQWI